MTRILLAASVLVAATLAPAAAAASDFDYRGRDVVTDTVFVADLDLSTGWGMDRLIKRLRDRIDMMCGEDEDCRDEAWLSADWQVARELKRDQWRRRIAYERAADRRQYRVMRFRRVGPAGGPPPMPAPAPRIAYAVPPGAVPVARTVTTTTRTFTVKTTTVTLTYRLPPPDYRTTCNCGR